MLNMSPNIWAPTMSFAQGNLAGLQAAAARQAEGYLKATKRMLDDIQDMTQTWLKYRHEYVDSSLNAVRRVLDSHDINETMNIYNEWLSDTVRRINEELSMIPDEMRKLGESARAIGEETAQATRQAADEVQQRAQQAASEVQQRAQQAADQAAGQAERQAQAMVGQPREPQGGKPMVSPPHEQRGGQTAA